ncbi:hypothetical protein J2X72_001203 [Phyllobacterium sp. 1468]|nr:hypothetical protein [Phyllobacterium sp. 1468]
MAAGMARRGEDVTWISSPPLLLSEKMASHHFDPILYSRPSHRDNSGEENLCASQPPSSSFVIPFHWLANGSQIRNIHPLDTNTKE